MKLGFQSRLAAVVIAASVCASAADLAILRNGNSIRHERRQVLGAVTRLYFTDAAGGYIEIPSDQIERFEIDTAPAPLPSQAQRIPTSPAVQKLGDPALALKPVAMSREELNKVVNGIGERQQIDPDFINSVIRAESGFHSRAVSKKGAQGLMQLMPGTASQLGVANPFDPGANVEGGTRYLRELLEKYNFDVPKALAAYNAGPRRVDQYRGVPPYYETQVYVARIIRDFNRRKLAENPALGPKPLGRKPKTASARSSQPKRTAVRRQDTHKTAPATSLPENPQAALR